jgi:DNA-directed RNA polymerase subunit M/transcription elongation factor TFIIS
MTGGVQRCPKCKDSLEFVKLADVDGGKVSIQYRCSKCKKNFKGSGMDLDPDLFTETIKTAKKLKKRGIEKVTKSKFNLPGPNDPISHLGKLCAMIFEKDGKSFIYEYSKPRDWGYLHHPDGSYFLVWESFKSDGIKKEKCLDCGRTLKFIGLSQTGSKVKPAYECKKCDKTFVGDPVDKNLMEKSVEYTEAFKMNDLEDIKKGSIDLPGKNEALVDLGICHGVVYISDKEGIKDQQYIHPTGENDSGDGNTERPRLLFYPGKHGGTLFIVGGAMRIDLGGVSRRHNFPGWLVD